MSARIVSLTRAAAVRKAAIVAARSAGLDGRSAKAASRYGLHLLVNGASAASAISAAVRSIAANRNGNDPEAA